MMGVMDTPRTEDVDARGLSPKDGSPSDQDMSPRNALIIVGVLVVLVVVLAGFLWQRHRADAARQEQAFQADKAQFARLEAEMKSAYTAMLAVAGQPLKHGDDKSCTRATAQPHKGQLTCNVAYNFIYGVDDVNQAYDLSAKLSAAVTAGGFAVKSSSSTFASLDKTTSKTQTIRMPLNDPTKSTCEFALAFNTSRLDLYKGIDKPFVADYFFTCNRSAAKPVYTLAK